MAEMTEIGVLDKQTSYRSSVYYHDYKIFITGGATDKNSFASEIAIEYDVKSLKQKRLPDMNNGRMNHASCILD